MHFYFLCRYNQPFSGCLRLFLRPLSVVCCQLSVVLFVHSPFVFSSAAKLGILSRTAKRTGTFVVSKLIVIKQTRYAIQWANYIYIYIYNLRYICLWHVLMTANKRQLMGRFGFFPFFLIYYIEDGQTRLSRELDTSGPTSRHAATSNNSLKKQKHDSVQHYDYGH